MDENEAEVAAATLEEREYMKAFFEWEQRGFKSAWASIAATARAMAEKERAQ